MIMSSSASASEQGHQSESKPGTWIGTVLTFLVLGFLAVSFAASFVGGGEKECTVTGGYTTVRNKRGSGMSSSVTIETEQCGELRWGATSFLGLDGGGASAEELDEQFPEGLEQGATYRFTTQGYRVWPFGKPSIVGVEEM